MRARPSHGFTYLMLLWWVAIGSIMLAALGQQWALESRRQKEIELVFRAEQIRDAIQSYYDATPIEPKLLPTSIDDLLEDRRGPVLKRHLRQHWTDPITGSPDWGLVMAGPFLRGVYSPSKQHPLRAPTSIETYEDWRFETDAVPLESSESAPSSPLGSSTNRHL
ncbi:MAG: type II secretion system protein [Rubrivivax sp.]|nr:MAG: type II secretion system protein [Rubrivivax sp.]